MGELEFTVEASKSRSGLHAERKLAFIVDKHGKIKRLDERLPGQATGKVYRQGYSRKIKVALEPGYYGIQIRLVKNSRGHVKGSIIVYDHNGKELLTAVLRRRKVRLSRGNPEYSWIVERIIEHLGLEGFIRRYNWNTGARRDAVL